MKKSNLLEDVSARELRKMLNATIVAVGADSQSANMIRRALMRKIIVKELRDKGLLKTTEYPQ